MTAPVVKSRNSPSWVKRQKTDVRVVLEPLKPATCGGIVNMALIRESEPDVDIREKK
jgi:hypothetical protein